MKFALSSGQGAEGAVTRSPFPVELVNPDGVGPTALSRQSTVRWHEPLIRALGAPGADQVSGAFSYGDGGGVGVPPGDGGHDRGVDNS